MRFLTFEIPTPLGPISRLGVLQGESTVLDVNLAYRRVLESEGLGDRAQTVADAVLPSNFLDYLNTGIVAQRALKEAVDFASAHGDDGQGPCTWGYNDVRLLAPITPVSYREFGQFEKHMTRGFTKKLAPVWYEFPIYWKGNPSTTIGPEEVIPWPTFSSVLETRMDIELEIAAVIGKAGKNIDAANAMDYVAGFTIFNDASARDQQFKEMEKGTGPCKGKDFANILGPVIVTPDEVDFTRFEVELRVNGESWSKVDTADMNFGWPEIVSWVSKAELIVPGDVLTSGTVNGCCGLERFDWPEKGPILNPGDVVECEVTGIGILRNQMGSPTNA